MENSLKGLILAAGIIITCIIVSLGFYIARQAKTTAQSGAGELQKLQAEFEDSTKTIYDGTIISGSEVRNAIRKFQGEKVGILVTTKKSSTYYGYQFSSETGEISEAASGNFSNAQTEGNASYINPNGKFQGTLIRDANGSITGIVFKQQ